VVATSIAAPTGISPASADNILNLLIFILFILLKMRPVVQSPVARHFISRSLTAGIIDAYSPLSHGAFLTKLPAVFLNPDVGLF
jgi:hypothetical protein